MPIAHGLHLTAPAYDVEWLKRWPNFRPAEFACKCAGRFCDGRYWHDEEFLDALQALRREAGRPLVINSGHRCPEWNEASDGARKSPHLKIAADIALEGHDRWALRDAAIRCGFKGLGFGRTFLHIDRRANEARWDYGPASRVAWKPPR